MKPETRLTRRTNWHRVRVMSSDCEKRRAYTIKELEVTAQVTEEE